MRKNFYVTPQAQQDMRGILRYIWHENPTASERMRDRFYEAFRLIGDNPYIGQVREDLTSKKVRFWPVHRNYMIIYNADSNPVDIVRIYQSAQNITSVLPS